MTRSVFTPSAITSALGMLVLASACGHSSQILDAYEKSKKNPIASGSGGSSNPGSGGTGGTGNMSGGGGTGMVGPQYDCNMVGSQQFDTKYMRAYSVDPADQKAADDALAAMTDIKDQATQMLGIPTGDGTDFQDIERSPDANVSGLGLIRGYNYRDAGRGVNLDAGQPNNRATDGNNYATAFPAPSIRAASWDLDLEKRVGEAAGDETAASLNNMLLAPCMNIIRHPYWGRTQETYGEDSYHIGRMASAFTVGLQEYVTGCAKHFAANNIELNRSTNNAIMNEQTLREIYGRHFEMVVQDAGVGCIMAAYNQINGTKSTENRHLLRDILKAPVDQGGFGFQGLVISDWWAMPGYNNFPDTSQIQPNVNAALEAGLDIEVPWQLYYSQTSLTQVPDADKPLVKEAARRVLTQKFRFKSATGSATDPASSWSITPPASRLKGASIDPASAMDHMDLAEETEIKSAVLLTNGIPAAAGMPATPVLPLKGATNIAVIGPDEFFRLALSSPPRTCPIDSGDPRACTFHFATDPDIGDRGSSRVNADPTLSIGPFDGVKAVAPAGTNVTSGNTADAAAGADAIIVVVGYTAGDEGEEYAISTGGDRATLDLPAGQNDFVNAALNEMKPTIIIVQSGSITNLPWLNHMNHNQATIWAGYGGMRGGKALARLIFSPNHENFSGKVPLAWPTQAELDLPDPANPAKKLLPFKDSETDPKTVMGYFFGYREYDRRKAAGMNPQLVFPFGHGLSYSTFTYSNLQIPCTMAQPEGIVDIKVDIQNTSQVDGDEVAMLFVKPPAKPAGITGDRPFKELKSFAKVHIPAGATAMGVELPVRIRDLRRWEGDDKTGHWTIDTGDYTIEVGKDADDADTNTMMQGKLTVQGY